MKHIKSNIDNLTHLWKTVSKLSNGYAKDDAISYSLIESSEWPNKIWSGQMLTQDILQNIRFLIKNSKIDLQLVDFEYNNRSNKAFMEANGFHLSSSMPGMHLKLTGPFETRQRLDFILVTNKDQAKIWCQNFKASFGYVISEDLVIKSMHKVNYYLAFDKDVPVGTVKIHRIKNVAGIYSLGVPPNVRGHGYAKDILYFTLHTAFRQGAVVATLQASKAAQGMYEQLGFKTDFTMNNYKLKTQ